jgi:hypothetical protein
MTQLLAPNQLNYVFEPLGLLWYGLAFPRVSFGKGNDTRIICVSLASYYAD